MHNALGPSGATLSLLFIVFHLLHKPKNSFCNELCATLHAPNHLRSSLRAPTQTAPFTNSNTSFRQQQCKRKSSLNLHPPQSRGFTPHLNMQQLLLESVIKLAQFLHLQARAMLMGHQQRTSPPTPVISPNLALPVDQKEKSQALHGEQQQH